ncbi:hypothetical protein FM114_03620 [Luteococcus japonicus LSP_Lj1]|uniref:Tyrosine specific protein phosphatases domain-containing protein n=1 Tax=Luteococcus japonicus LSP_Lj1 TaxID=1255658 RepID=A0A1R4ITC3_9ACTN|nr:hypothetical protein FM114_03620 [Luteococcus japonicus LSP_Lj1]
MPASSLGRESCSSTSVTVAGIWAPCERTNTFPAAQTNQTRADGTVALVVQRSASFARKPQAVAEVGGHPRQRVRLRTRGHCLVWLLVVRGQTWSSRHRPTAAINSPLQRSVFFRCHGPSHASSVVGMDSSASECSLRQRQESATAEGYAPRVKRVSSGGHTGCSGSPAARRGGVAERAPGSWAPLVSTHHYSRRARPLRLVARPESPWPYTWLKWPDFGLPLSREAAWAEIERAWRLAEVERVEVACGGGRGHTGTALAAMAILDGLEADAAVAWVRNVYDPGAVESPWQRGWLRRH